jgi:K+-sensing histidine kinase KdpD
MGDALAGAAGGGSARVLPPAIAGLSARRRAAGCGLIVVLFPPLTAVLVWQRATLSLPSDLLLFLLGVVLIAAVGGMLAAVLAAVTASLSLNYWFTPPYHELRIAQRDHVLALLVFLAVAITVSATVEVAARQRSHAARSRAEALTLSRLASSPLSDQSVPAVLEQIRTLFGMDSVALLRRSFDNWRPLATVGEARDWSGGDGQIVQRIDDTMRLVASGPDVFAEDRRVLSAYTAAVTRALAAQELASEAAQKAARARELAAADELRSALLAAVGHDLRTPLAVIKAAVSTLRQDDVEWTPEQSEELLASIEESADRLDALVANLLDASRLRAGVLSVDRRPVSLDEVVSAALLVVPPSRVTVSVSESLPLVLADRGLLERVIANLVANALRFTQPGEQVLLRAGQNGGVVRLAVVDCGPGVPAVDRDRMFAPFQRLGDIAFEGTGLGLSIARVFTEAMAGTLTASDTPGGGLTMTVTLPVAP